MAPEKTDGGRPTMDKPFRPPLPNPIADLSGNILKSGCYRLSLDEEPKLVGTMRVNRADGKVTASGDLYGDAGHDLSGQAQPPIFPRDVYREYVLVTTLSSTDRGFGLGLKRFRYKGDTARWQNQADVCRAELTEEASPSGPLRFRVLRDGEPAGNLTLDWASDYLRRAVVEIDTAPESEVPLSNGSEITWESIYESVGWKLDACISNRDVKIGLPELSGDGKHPEDIRKLKKVFSEAMQKWRDSTDLDTKWIYHLLCIPKLHYDYEEDQMHRGFMHDMRTSLRSPANRPQADARTEEIPQRPPVLREGAAIASHGFPNKKWGASARERYGRNQPFYFRTAVHEIGHAQGLDHSCDDDGIMNVTRNVFKAGPDRIKWCFHPEDKKRLCHWPDPCVRPGGIDG